LDDHFSTEAAVESDRECHPLVLSEDAKGLVCRIEVDATGAADVEAA
jgi:hypothetical protein